MTPGQVAAAVLALITVIGCTSQQEQQDQSAAEPYVNTIARQAAALPGVDCATGGFPDGGTGSSSSQSLFLYLVVADLDDPALPGLLREAGRLMWASPLPISALEVSLNAGSRTLSEVIRGTERDVDPLTADELAQEYGPRPSLPATLPPLADPGRLTC